MNHLQILMIVVVCFFFHVKAQDKPAPGSGQGALAPFHPRLAVVIGIISIILSVMFIILAYAKFCQENAFDLFRQHQAEFQGLARSCSRYSGFDESAINALPFFRFSSLKGSKEGLECAICISRFEDEEILRLLPKCRHAFHKNCIDQWLTSHSSCPLCRYTFYPDDLKSLTYSKSLRYLRNPSNRLDDLDLEITVQREQQDHHQGSSRFNLSSRFYKGKKEELLLVQDSNHANDRKDKILDKFRHKIVVSDVMIKNRWSDVNSSDLMSLNCEMLREMSSSRLYPLNSSSARFYSCLSKCENIEKIKEDIERKRLRESKNTGRSTSASTSYNEENSSKLVDFPKMRSMSEISKVSRFREFSMTDKFKESASPRNVGKEERTRRLWLPIAERTVRWLENRERNSKEIKCKLPSSHV